MKTKFKFSTANLKSIPANDKSSASTEKEYSDTELTGLKLLSGKNGSKRFLLRYRFQGKKSSIAISSFPDIDLTTARKVARKHKAQLAEGIAPKAERNAKVLTPTVSDFFYQTYLPLAKKRKRTWDDDLSRFNNHCASIKNIPYDELTAHHIMQLHLDMSESSNKYRPYSPSTCNRVLALLKTMGKLANKLLDIPNVAEKVSYCRKIMRVHDTARLKKPDALLMLLYAMKISIWGRLSLCYFCLVVVSQNYVSVNGMT